MAAQRRQIEVELSRLLPTFGSAPREIINLSESILAQTQSHYLSPTEAPARVFACCQVACERLSSRLALPELILAQAPVPARKYKIVVDGLRKAADGVRLRRSNHTSTITTTTATSGGGDAALDDIIRSAIASLPNPPDMSRVRRYTSSLRQTHGQIPASLLVAAVVLSLLQHDSDTRRLPRGTVALVQRGAAVRKPELDAAMRSICTGLHDLIDADRNTSTATARGGRGRDRIAKVTMRGSCPDFASDKRRVELAAWKERLREVIRLRKAELATTSPPIPAQVR